MLQRATSHDITAIHALIERAYRGDSARLGWTHEADLLGGQRTDRSALESMLADPDQHLMIAREGPEIPACILLVQKPEQLVYIGMVTVDPERQGTGIGRALLETAETYAAELGAKRLEMTVIAQREELIAWYERRGYRQTGERRPFPDDPRGGIPKRHDLAFAVLEKSL